MLSRHVSPLLQSHRDVHVMLGPGFTAQVMWNLNCCNLLSRLNRSYSFVPSSREKHLKSPFPPVPWCLRAGLKICWRSSRAWNRRVSAWCRAKSRRTTSGTATSQPFFGCWRLNWQHPEATKGRAKTGPVQTEREPMPLHSLQRYLPKTPPGQAAASRRHMIAGVATGQGICQHLGPLWNLVPSGPHDVALGVAGVAHLPFDFFLQVLQDVTGRFFLFLMVRARCSSNILASDAMWPASKPKLQDKHGSSWMSKASGRHSRRSIIEQRKAFTIAPHLKQLVGHRWLCKKPSFSNLHLLFSVQRDHSMRTSCLN